MCKIGLGVNRKDEKEYSRNDPTKPIKKKNMMNGDGVVVDIMAGRKSWMIDGTKAM